MAITRRTILRKALLAPWDSRVATIWLYSLAKAARDNDVDVNHTMLAVNHQHSVATPRAATLPKFMHAAHHKTSSALNRLLLTRGMDALGQVWDGRQPHTMRLLDAEAEMTQLVYQQVQNVASGLVDRPEEMPGFVFDWNLWLPGRAVVVPRFEQYFDARTHPEELELRFTPPRMLLDTFEGDVSRLVYHMEKLTEHACQAICRMRKRPARGATAVRAIHPYDEPRTMREKGPRRVPTFRVGAKGIVGHQQRIVASVGATRFRGRHGDSMDEWTSGNREVVFPYGTYEMARLHGVNVEEAPPPGCILTTPRSGFEDAVTVVENSRDALIDEAETFLDELDFALPEREGEESGVVVQTLRGPRRTDPGNPPRRIVVRREQRRTNRRGNDPPLRLRERCAARIQPGPRTLAFEGRVLLEISRAGGGRLRASRSFESGTPSGR